MKIQINYTQILTLFLLLALSGCASTPEPVSADSAFSGYAFLDSNFNGELDPEDAPLESAIFYVVLDSAKAFADETDENGSAFILIPSAMDYPVTLGMDAPKDSGLKAIGPSEIDFSIGDNTPKFLFSSR